MRVLVTGSSGFIGANIVEVLTATGHEVVAFDRPGSPSPLPPERLRTTELLEADILDRTACLRAAEGCDAVVHGAAVTPSERTDLDTARRAFEVNLFGTLNIIEACEKVCIHLVYLGSASVYGPVEEAVLDEESTAPAPAGAYALSKFAAETFAVSRQKHGLSLTALRLGSVFGPYERDTGMRDTISAIHQVTRAALLGEEVVLPRPGFRDWIYARDVASAVCHLLTVSRQPIGPINIALGKEWSVAQWCESLSRHFDFSWRIDPDAPTIAFYGDNDRPPLSVDRMRNVLDFVPRFDRDLACADYLEWLRNGGNRND